MFEQALDGCPPNLAKALYLLYGQYEEDHGLAKKAMLVYDRATKAVDKKYRMEMFNYYIAKAVDFFGLISARPIFEKAMEALADKEAKQMGLKFAELEVKLGELDRARAIYAHTSQFADPRVDKAFWEAWHQFEVRFGNEDTYKDMLRIKRSVEAVYAGKVQVMAEQILAHRSQQQDANGATDLQKPSMTFISAGATVNGRPVEQDEAQKENEPKSAKTSAVNPDEIQMSDEDETDAMDTGA